jgi:hypothetical protein
MATPKRLQIYRIQRVACAVGEKPLGNMMANMSKKYALSQRYTNHSIRVTSLQLLEDNNIEGRHIIRVSGHKSVDSVKTYARRLSTSRKRKNISSILSTSIASNNKDENKSPKRSVVTSNAIQVPSSLRTSEFKQFADELKDDNSFFLQDIADEILLYLLGESRENSFSINSLFKNPSGHSSNFTPVFHSCNVTFNVNLSK